MSIKHVTAACVFAAVAAVASPTKAEVTIGNVSSKFDISIYGYIKLDAAYDSQATAIGDAAFFVLPQTDGKNDSEFNMTARQTRLGLNIGGPDVADGKVSAKLEMDFYGKGDSDNGYHPRMRLGYLQWKSSDWGFVAGQDWDAFITAVPKSVNFAYLSDQGALGLRRPMFKLFKDVVMGENKLTLKVAAARTIGQDIDGLGQDDGADSTMPSLQYNAMISGPWFTEKAARAGISGHWGQETVDATDTIAEKDYDTWSVILSAVLPLTDMFSLQGTIWSGSNLDTYYGGIGQGINTKTQSAIGSQGGWMQFMVNVCESINVNAMVGMDDPEDGDLSAGMRSKNQYLGANAYYKWSPEMEFALEYVNLTTSYMDSEDETDNRIQGSVTYYF